MEVLLERCERLGLTKQEAVQFISAQQQREREDRLLAREEKKLEQEREQAELQRRHEIQLEQMKIERLKLGELGDQTNKAKVPKLPTFTDGKDDLDSYLQRFERFATANKWDKGNWAVALSALLTGKALDVYSRLSETAAVDYGQLKEALLKRYNLQEDGYRRKFRDCKPEVHENCQQLVVRLMSYFETG